MPPTSRTARSVPSRTRPNSLPRWLCSRMPIPDPSRSQIACWARRRTSSGRVAGPDEKFSLRMRLPATRVLFPVEHGDRDAVERLVRGLRDHDIGHNALGTRGDPRSYLLAQLIAVRDHRRRKHLDPVDLDVFAKIELAGLIRLRGGGH